MFFISYRDDDSHSPMNGKHRPLPSGAAIVRAYPSAEIAVGNCFFRDAVAADFDNLAPRETLRCYVDGGIITAERAA